MARSTLDNIISTLRGMTDAGHTDWQLGTATYWDADQLEQVLDRHRADVYRELLTARPKYASGGTVQYLEYRSQFTHFEPTDGGTAVFEIEDGAGNNFASSGWSADYARGIVTFTSDTQGSAVYLTGRVFDLNAAAADVWRTKAANSAKLYDMSTDNHSLSRSQLKAHCLEMAAMYEGMTTMTVVTLYRSDTP